MYGYFRPLFCYLTSSLLVFYLITDSLSATVNDAGQKNDNAALLLLTKAAVQSAHVTSLYADFSQEKKMGILNRPLNSRGYFSMMRGENATTGEGTVDLLWMYTHPVPSGFLYRGGKIFFWDGKTDTTRLAQGREEAVVSAIIRQMLGWLTIDSRALSTAYHIMMAENDDNGLILQPLRKSFYTSLSVVFSLDCKTITRLSFTEKNGDSVEIAFKNFQINETLPTHCLSLLEIAENHD